MVRPGFSTTSVSHWLRRFYLHRRSLIPWQSGRFGCLRLQAQLRSALAVFYALGGAKPETADDLAGKAYSQTTQPIEVLKLATNSLGELKRMADQGGKLRLA